MSGPLDGYKIVELTSTVSGPLAGMMLADQGADVVKVEPPLLGDLARFMGSSRDGVGGMFAVLNRNKKSVVLDLKDENEIVICTHVTSPFIKLKTIKNAVKKLKNYDSVTSVTKHQEFSWVIKKKKLIPINFNTKIVKKTQNLDPIYMSNGAFFIFKKKTFKKYNNRIGKKPYYYELKFPESVEIDNKEDLDLAMRIL